MNRQKIRAGATVISEPSEDTGCNGQFSKWQFGQIAQGRWDAHILY